MSTRLEVDSYTVAIICPLPIELSAVRRMFDEEYLPPNINPSDDDNYYTFGSICGHNVVLLLLPLWKNGLISASHAVNPLSQTFKKVQVTLIVGIGGGLPSESPSTPDKQLRLGDVVIGWDGDKNDPIIHWDANRRARKLPPPSRRILNILGGMEANRIESDKRFLEHLNRCNPYTDGSTFKFPGRVSDRLFEWNYDHVLSQRHACDQCDPSRIITRSTRPTDDFQLHYGRIASVESVVEGTQTRNMIRDETKALCVEMEAAGILERMNGLVIRGISDYADSHKNDIWKGYAAATAASVAREFLSIMTPYQDKEPPSHSLSRPPPPSTTSLHKNEYYLMPRNPTPLFTGRQHALDEMEESLFPKSKSSAGQKRFVIHGEGGRGKTQLCLKFAEQHREEFWGIFWIHSSSRRTIERSFIDIAKLCKREEDVDMVKIWLSNRPNRWLLIFDNADDPKLDISRYFPVGDRGMILITTRDKGGRKYATVGDHALGPMAIGEATTLLLKTVDNPTTASTTQQSQAHDIVKTLQYSPLAIEKVGVAIRKTKSTMEEYLVKYGKPKEKATSNNQTPHSYRANLSWDVSVEMMENQSGTVGQDAVDLLHIFSYFHYHGISEITLEQSCRYIPTSPSDYHKLMTYRKTLLSRSRLHEWTIGRFREAISMLLEFSLINRDNDDLISIHPLIHNWARDRARAKLGHELAEKLWVIAVCILGTSIPWTFTTNDYLYRRWLNPHIQSCLEATDYRRVFEVNDTNTEWLRILERLALAYTEHSRREEAMTLLQGIVQSRRTLLGLSHPETLRAMNSLAQAYGGVGQPYEALRMTEIVLNQRIKTLPSNHPDLLASKYSLAVRYGGIGKPEQALDMLEKVLVAQEQVSGSDDLDTLRTKNSLANYYGETGEHHLACTLLQSVLHTRKQLLNDFHPETLGTMHNLAIWTGKIGQRDEALSMMETVVQRRKETLSQEHPDTLRSMFSLALYYQESWRIIDAWKIMQSVLETRRRVLGEDHPDTKRAYKMVEILESRQYG